ncbi:MAG: GNAT family N-acetyltransferase [Anaerolineae bacterium]|nr:GNAT family N-acetyltransferase [Anaerolineae bacterium]
MPPLVYRPVSDVNFEAFTAAFNLAYSDYFMPIAMTAPSFRALIERDDLDLRASVAALDGDEIVGTGLLGIREQVGWIGGLGVIPERRRQGIGRQMMVYLLDRARERGLSTVKLEVIEKNTGAYHLYCQLGFTGGRYLLALNREPGQVPEPDMSYQIKPQPVIELLEHYTVFHDTPNCWQRALPSLTAIAPHAEGWAAVVNGRVASYALGWANDHTIRLIDFAADPGCDRPAAAQALLAHLHRQHPAAHGSSYNIADNDPILPAYQALGYTVALRQIEMQLFEL